MAKKDNHSTNVDIEHETKTKVSDTGSSATGVNPTPTNEHRSNIIRIAILTTIIVVLVGSSIAALVLVNNNNKKITKSNPTAAFKEDERSDLISDKIGESNAENKSRNIAQLESEANSSVSKVEKADYLQGDALIAFNNGDYAKCIELAKKADVASQDAISASLVADCSYGLNDYKVAVQYYGIAADRSEKTSDPTLNSPYNDYKLKQKEAQAML